MFARIAVCVLLLGGILNAHQNVLQADIAEAQQETSRDRINIQNAALRRMAAAAFEQRESAAKPRGGSSPHASAVPSSPLTSKGPHHTKGAATPATTHAPATPAATHGHATPAGATHPAATPAATHAHVSGASSPKAAERSPHASRAPATPHASPAASTHASHAASAHASHAASAHASHAASSPHASTAASAHAAKSPKPSQAHATPAGSHAATHKPHAFSEDFEQANFLEMEAIRRALSATTAPGPNQQRSASQQGQQGQQSQQGQQGGAAQPDAAKPAEAWWLPPASAYAAAASTYGAPGLPAMYPQAGLPGYLPPYGYGYPQRNAAPASYGYPYYGYYPMHPYGAVAGGGHGYHNIYSYYPSSYSFKGGAVADEQHERMPRFAEKHLDGSKSDVHAAADAAGYKASHWKDFAQEDGDEDARMAMPLPSAYRPAQRAAILKMYQEQHAAESGEDEGVESDLAKLEKFTKASL